MTPSDFIWQGFAQGKKDGCAEWPIEGESLFTYRGKPLPYMPFCYKHPQYWQVIAEETKQTGSMIASRKLFDDSGCCAGGTERRTHGRRGIRGTGGNLEFDNSLDLLSHFFPSLSAKPPGIPTGADGPQNQRLLLRLRLHVLHGHLLDLPVVDVDRDLAAEDVDFNLELALVGIHH